MNWHVRSPLAILGCVLAAIGFYVAGAALLSTLNGGAVAALCVLGALLVVCGMAALLREMRRG